MYYVWAGIPTPGTLRIPGTKCTRWKLSTKETKYTSMYGVVYLKRGNDLYVAKDMSRMLPISSPITSLQKAEC